MLESRDLMSAGALDPEVARLWAAAREAGCGPADPMAVPLAAARAAAERHHAFLAGGGAPALEVEDLIAATDAGPLRVRLFRPSAGPDLPVLVYFHGGGFVVNSVATHDHLLRLLALGSGAVVCAVDYDKAPEHRFPRQHDQAVAAVRWVARGAAGLGIDPARIAVGGDSAGANLALAAALARRGERPVACGLLLYGMFAPDFDTASHRRFGDGGHGLSTERMRWYWRQYLGSDRNRTDPRAVPLLADLAGAPPMILVGAGLDCLLDDTLRLSEALSAAGVDHQLTVALTLPHSFAPMAPRVGAAAAIVSAVAGELRAQLGAGK